MLIPFTVIMMEQKPSWADKENVNLRVFHVYAVDKTFAERCVIKDLMRIDGVTEQTAKDSWEMVLALIGHATPV